MTGDKYAVEVSNITKKFRLYDDKGYTLKEKALHWGRNRYEYREVLKGISFQIKKGEAVGLIGQNGCGKSTVLKLLTKIMYPDSGMICVRGRVSSLLELGAGFHPDMSGRENIYINASILGLTKKEIDRRIDSIIAFSELEEFIDNPVRTYSSGMYMRLAFSVAVSVDADVLLIDEILAVGDVNFQAKCFRKLMEIKGAGTTIVIVSHSMDQVERICDKCIWINQGKIELEGNVNEVQYAYLEHMGIHQEYTQSQAEIVKHLGSGEVRVVSVKAYNKNNIETQAFKEEEKIVFEIGYQVISPVWNANMSISIIREDGINCYGVNMITDDLQPLACLKDGVIRIVFCGNFLLPGNYSITLCITAGSGSVIDGCNNLCQFKIYGNKGDSGVVRIPHEWVLLEQ